MIAHYTKFKFYANERDVEDIEKIINGLGILILDNHMSHIQLPHEKPFMVYYECLSSKDSYKKFKKFANEWNFTIVIMD